MTTSTRQRGETLYRLLLRLYPADFRARYGDDMVDFYRDRARGLSRRDVLRLWTRLLPDLIGSAVAERFPERRRRRAAAFSSTDSHRREESMSVLTQDIRYAFRSMIPGKATGAHIHIGPPSNRLRGRS